MYQITGSLVQDWVTQAAAEGLSPRSLRKYHTMLHSMFKRAVRDQLIVTNPCEHTELPKIIARKSRTLTPTGYDLLISAIPERHRLLVETAIETGIRWGELIALRPRHIDFRKKSVTVEETIIEVSKKHSPTGQRYLAKPYPKDNEPRTLGVLELDHQYTRLVEEWNHDLVAQIRRCGRAAGKRLGYKIRTLASDPDRREDRRIAVWVIVTDSNPDDEDRIRERSELLINQTLNQLLG